MYLCVCVCMYDGNEEYLYVHEMNGDIRIVVKNNKNNKHGN